MRRISAARLAQIGIGIQMLALLRTLAEYFRLRHFGSPPLTLQSADLWIGGALINTIFLAVAVACFFLGKFRTSALVALLTVVVLLIWKFAVMGS